VPLGLGTATRNAAAAAGLRSGMRSHRRHGFTLIEVLVCLAVLGSLAAVGLAFARPAGDMRAATALKALLLWARAEALWQGAAVSVSEAPGGTAFEVRRLAAAGASDAGSGGAADCTTGEVIGRLGLSEHPGVRVATGFGPRGGLLWLPTGSGRSCSGGGVIS